MEGGTLIHETSEAVVLQQVVVRYDDVHQQQLHVNLSVIQIIHIIHQIIHVRQVHSQIPVEQHQTIQLG